ncbi:hypothetical protein OCV67_10285, partial [Porcipelethomonas ammoniilytica]|uniref:hypothetical protein n=1 Tax=Porcipelethomonas ammoniilytica TaxID=2981722 RepID=UPI0021CE4A04
PFILKNLYFNLFSFRLFLSNLLTMVQYIPFEEDTDPNFTGYTMTPQEFADEELDENQEFGGMQL